MDVICYLDPDAPDEQRAQQPRRLGAAKVLVGTVRRLWSNPRKRIAEEMRLHPNTISTINLGRHPIQARLVIEGGRQLPPARPQERQAQAPLQVCAEREPISSGSLIRRGGPISHHE
jgi:hypothetical protein